MASNPSSSLRGTDTGHPAIKTSAKRALRRGDDRRHSREDALTDREFEKLVEATYRLPERKRAESRLALYLTGRLGLRGGEVAHLDASWVDWQENVIEIPEHDACTKGDREGEVCGYCRQRATAEMEANNLSIEEATYAVREEFASHQTTESEVQSTARRLREAVNITHEEAISRRWKPKTPNAARRVPFDIDVRAALALEQFFEEYDAWERSKCTVNRRINAVSEESALEKRVYPHSLRATAASELAKRNVSEYSLMAIMGWSDISTAKVYIQSNDERAAIEVRSKNR